MVGKTKRATKAERERMDALSRMPCIACLIRNSISCAPVEVHHLLSGNKRRGHKFTIPLCAWHHRGEYSNYLWDRASVEAYRGPSLARSSKRFHEVFGSDDELLALVNERLEHNKHG
jgi:hypothetical protein